MILQIVVAHVKWINPKSNLLERLDPAEEPFKGTVLPVGFWIKLEWPPLLRVFPRSPVD